MIFDGAGNLYGTTSGGGAHYGGTVFELTPGGDHGRWKAKVLYDFGDPQHPGGGHHPAAGLVLDKRGNLYGTATLGGTYGDGTVFELTRSGKGKWTEKVLHNFVGSDGVSPKRL